MIRSIRTAPALIVLVACLVAAPASLAGYAPVSPGHGAAVAPGAITYAFAGSCSPDVRCGVAGSSAGADFANVQVGTLRLSYGGTATATAASGPADLDTLGSPFTNDSGGFNVTASPASSATNQLLRAGTHYWQLGWFECAVDAAGASACQRASSPVASFTVRTVVTADARNKPYVRVDRSTKRGHSRWSLHASCNAPSTSYRTELLIEKRARVGATLRWVTVGTLRQKLESRPDLLSCSTTYDWKHPRGLGNKIRGTFLVKSAPSVKPAMPIAAYATPVVSAGAVIG